MSQTIRSSNLLEQVNEIVETPFESLDACYEFYCETLPKRVGAYHQEEVGPIYHHDLPGEADKFVNKIFHIGEGVLDMSGGLNWYATATGDLEWNGGLVRHGYFMLLAEEYRKTGDEKYARAIVEHMLHYIENVPPFEPEGRPYLEYKKSTWRPFEAAGRAAETWPEALAKIINSESMNAEAWARILISVHQHAVFLRKEHWKTGNHATLEVAAVGILAIFYREFKESAAWLEYAVEFLDGMWPDLFNDDGYSKEMSGGYHWVAMRSFFSFYEVALSNGYRDLFPANYRDRLVKNSLAEFYQDKPNFSTPISNDSNTRINRREQLERICKLFDIQEIEYFLSNGEKGEKPSVASYLYPTSKIAIMRNGWTADANYLYFDMGAWGDNHMNQDQLSVELYAKGRHFLVNGGKWRYTTSDPDAEWMGLAKYFKNTSSYNCVLVNGYEQIFGDARGDMISGGDFDYADGIFDAGFGEEVPGRDEKLFRERGLSTLMENRLPGVSHRRQVFFAKPDFWIIRDTIAGPNVERAEQLWHFYDGAIAPVGGDLSVWSTNFNDSNLVVKTIGSGELTARSYEGQKEPFFAGWHCPYYDIIRPAPELRFEQTANEEVVFHTLLMPVSGKVDTAPDFTIEGATYKVTLGSKAYSIDTGSDGPWTVA